MQIRNKITKKLEDITATAEVGSYTGTVYYHIFVNGKPYSSSMHNPIGYAYGVAREILKWCLGAPIGPILMPARVAAGLKPSNL